MGRDIFSQLLRFIFKMVHFCHGGSGHKLSGEKKSWGSFFNSQMAYRTIFFRSDENRADSEQPKRFTKSPGFPRTLGMTLLVISLGMVCCSADDEPQRFKLLHLKDDAELATPVRDEGLKVDLEVEPRRLANRVLYVIRFLNEDENKFDDTKAGQYWSYLIGGGDPGFTDKMHDGRFTYEDESVQQSIRLQSKPDYPELEIGNVVTSEEFDSLQREHMRRLL